MMQQPNFKIKSDIPLSDWRGSLTSFNGFTSTRPDQEFKDLSWPELWRQICGDKAAVITDKKLAKYFIPCELKAAPLVGKTLEAAIKNGESTVGKMRSKSHVTAASNLVVDIDGILGSDFVNSLDKLKEYGIAFIAYTTYSNGDPAKPGMRVRLIIPVDRPVGIDEYLAVWHGFCGIYFNGQVADSSSANLYQQQGTWSCHPSFIEHAQSWKNDGGVASANTLIELGKSVLTQQSVSEISSTDSSGHDNRNGGSQYPPSDANKIVDRCNQIRAFRDTKGANQSEPLWRDCLGVVGFCENGKPLCHDWSSGHSGYTEAKTSQKLAYRLKVPPTTCAQFKKSNPSGCQGCLQKCKSPISLGRNDRFEAESKSSGESIDLLEKIQQQYCLLNISGRLWVLDRSTLNIHSNQSTGTKLSLSNRSDGALFLTRTAKSLSPQVDASKIAKEFFVSPNTICFDRVEFNPAGTSANVLNLWVGPTITPKPGEWKLIAAYLLEVICDKDQESYAYLLKFIAHALQKPEEKPGILVILLGGQGIGKGTLARILKRIWSSTFLQIHNIDSVTGSFNAALECNFIVFMDEALFVGDRRASDALKSLVTEPVIHINEKHQPARQMQSFHRFFAATNAEHFKNTERDDRRDFVLRVSESRMNDYAYWQALNSEIEKGGIEAMMHDLLSIELQDFNVRAKPSTQALIDQKLHSLDPIPRWWYNSLIDGEFSEDGKWPDFISTDNIISSVVELAGKRLYRKPDKKDVSNAMKKLCPSASKKQQQNGYERARGYSLPPLDQARAEFEVYIGGKIVW